MPKINFVLPDSERGWVMEKMVLRSAEALRDSCEVTAAGIEDPAADVNHWAHYLDLWQRRETCVSGESKTSFWVTHVDDPYKLRIVRDLCASGKAAICLSSDMAAALDAENIRSDMVTYALPGTDGGRALPKIVIGLATRLYGDGRKNEWMLTKLCSEFGRDHLEFRIWGGEWDAVVAKMRGSGVEVKYEPDAAYDALLDGLAECDYYLYCGMDEGSLGTLDALKAGTRTIVTDQGFHRDLSTAIDFLFSDYDELRTIISSLVESRVRKLAAISATSWEACARRHLAIWNHLIFEGVCPARSAEHPGKPAYQVSNSLVMAWRNKSFFRYYGLAGLRTRLRNRLTGRS